MVRKELFLEKMSGTDICPTLNQVLSFLWWWFVFQKCKGGAE